MTAKVVRFRPKLVGAGKKLTAARVLNAAKKADLRDVVICAFDVNGEMYCASTEGPGDAIWLLEAAKLHLLTGGEH